MKCIWSDWVYVIHVANCTVPVAAFVSAYAATKFFKILSDQMGRYPEVHRYRFRLDDPMVQERENLTYRWIDFLELPVKGRSLLRKSPGPHSYEIDGLPF